MAIFNITPNEYKKLSKREKSKVRYYFKQELKKRRQQARNNPTETEQLVKDLFISNKISFEFQKILKQYRVDFYLRQVKTIIEIDGDYHLTPLQKFKDKNRENVLLSHGKVNHILRFGNDYIKNNPVEFINKIKDHIASYYHPIA